MNNKHILDLTLRLSQALDQNYDVVSMETVLSVISSLEGTTITKEQLEATRLAKYINQLRRRTKCENLARRAKSLLKRWREMVGIQQSNDSTAVSGVVSAPTAIAVNPSSTASAPFNMPVSDNAVCTSHLTNPQFSQHCQRQQQYQSNVKHQIQQQSYHSQPSSPLNPQDKSNPNEFLVSISNPATGSQMQKSSKVNVRKKRKIEKSIENEQIQQQQQQPTSFANLITGLGSTFGSSRKATRDKSEPVKPVETFIIEHSSNSNSDLICIPSNNNVSSNFTSATDVPPVVIDLQDTNSSMNSLVSKDVTNASSSSYRNKISIRKSKKEKKRKERSVASLQNQPLQDCDDQNNTTASYLHKRPRDGLLLDEKSHSVCPTISNISEILSLSNSSMSSVFPSADAMSKNVFQSTQNELVSSSAQMSKSDLTFAGKFKRNTSSTSTGCVNYNSDSMNVNLLNNNSSNQKKFSLFCGMGTTNSNDSSSSSRTSSFHEVVLAVKREASNSRHNIEDLIVKHDINEKSMSNMSNKGNFSADNAFAVGSSTVAGPQHHQSIDLTTMDFSSQQAVKQPKKRGRKRGSKAADSVITKEISLSSQMLKSSIGTAGKKVKTTKELYAEMENRKLLNVKITGLAEMAGNSSANCIGKQQQEKTVNSRRPSFCSDIMESDSCTMTSEPSRDSGNILSKATIGKSDTPLDNNSNYSKQDYECKTGDVKSDEGSRHLNDGNSVLDMLSKVKLEMQNILKLLTPPPSVKQIEYECFNSVRPCTCTIEEVTAPADNKSNESIGNNNSTDSNLNATNSTNISEKESDNFKKIQTEQMANVTENFKCTDKDLKDTLPQPLPPAKVKKSIFDLDFDDDEDPLNTIIADIAGKNFKSEKQAIISAPVTDDKSELPLSTEDDLGKVDHQNTPYALNVPTPSSDNIVFPSYEVKYDPDCKAKNRFEVQTQKITKFHIDTLHNCFIPNVNGNWNHADAGSPGSRITDDGDRYKTDIIIDGDNVVPFYGSDMNEQIVKDLSHIKFTKNFKVKPSKCQNQNGILFHVPFLGVSRIPDVADTKLRCNNIKNLTLDEEKENVDNKLNLNNIITNASALDINDAKEREEVGMKCVENAETSSNTTKLKTNVNRRSGFKRIKNHATLVKRSTIKRLKLPANGNLETNPNDSNESDYVDKLKLHRRLFFHEELYPVSSHLSKECIFHISSCSSGCNSTDEETTDENLNYRKRTASSSSSSSSCSEHHILNLQHDIIQAEIEKRAALNIENNRKNDTSDELSDDPTIANDEKVNINCVNNDHYGDDNDCNDLPEENNRMLLSFNNIYNKSTRNDNAEQQNKDRENNMLKQQLQNCDDYNNLNNFNLIKYIDNKTSSVNNINNNNTNSCSNNLSDTNVNISSSSCSHENPTDSTLIHHHQHNNNDNDVQIKSRVADEDVSDGNNCGRLQKFKEWHEVLQLHSYNDELLTVLPYVVLE